MSFLAEYGLFLAKTLTILVAVVAIIMTIAITRRQGIGGDDDTPNIHTNDLNEQYRSISNEVRDAGFEDDKERSRYHKEFKKKEKAKQKKREKERKANSNHAQKPIVYVVNFEGDIEANSVSTLRTLISAIIDTAKDDTSVLLRLESPGGAVNGYGLAASQLDRLRNHQIPLTIAVDKVAASGGYMMASVANRIIAAPFSIIGSIGVVASLPNFHRLLEDNKIDYEQITAGEYKRTLTVFGENDEASRTKVKQELEEIHDLFKQHIAHYRPDLDMAKIATGEIWLGTQAIELGLIDEICTSDDFLMQRLKDSRVIELSIKEKKSLAKRLGLPFGGQARKMNLPFIH